MTFSGETRKDRASPAFKKYSVRALIDQQKATIRLACGAADKMQSAIPDRNTTPIFVFRYISNIDRTY